MKPEEMIEDLNTPEVRAALVELAAHADPMENPCGRRVRALLDAIRPKPRTVHLPAADLPAPLEEVPERGWTLAPYHEHGAVVLTGAPAIEHALGHGLLWRTREEAEAWLAHLQSWRNPRPGDDWTPHTPGDPMPCHGSVEIVVKTRDGTHEGPVLAHAFDWRDLDHPGDITAWRYAREGEG